MSSSIPPQLHQSLRLLIRANHILHKHDLVDAFGHISIRHPLNPSQYIIAAYDPGAPALVKSLNDFIAYHVSDSSPVDKNSPQGYSERYIHGEIFRRYPEAKCVVHSHSDVVIPFTLGDVGVRPVFHMAGFLGAQSVPVFKAEDYYAGLESSKSYQADMLIKNQDLGAALAESFDAHRPVVLQHKHGFTTWGDSIQQAVYRAIYTQTNCKLLAQAIAFAGGDAGKVAYLSGEEAKACKVMNEKCEDKCWRLWVREVQVNPLYVSEEGEPESLKVAGMKVRKGKKATVRTSITGEVETSKVELVESPREEKIEMPKLDTRDVLAMKRFDEPMIQRHDKPLKGYCVDCGIAVR